MLGPEISAFLGQFPMPVLVVGSDQIIRYATKAAFELLGGDDVVVGKHVEAVLGAHSASGPQSGTEEFLSMTASDGQEQKYTVKRAEFPLGGDLFTSIYLTPVPRATEGGRLARQATLRLRHIIEMLPQAVCVFDDQDRYVLWNEKYAELYPDIADHLRTGMAFEDILKISLAGGEFLEVVPDPELWLQERMEKFRRAISQEEQKLRDGRWLRHDDRRTPDGGAIGMRIDITELKQREEWLRQLFDANPMPMLLCDSQDLQILQANDAALRFFGYGHADLLAKKASDMHAHEQLEQFCASAMNLLDDCEARTVWRVHRGDGSERHVLIYFRLLHEGPDRRLLLTIADVSDRIMAEAEAKHLADHDVLTGLPNRARFYKALSDAFSLHDPRPVTVFCLDLDGFKPVNDTFGHAAGDEVLKLVAERLRLVMKGLLVARLGGDEFAVLCREPADNCLHLAADCVAAFREPFVIRGLPMSIGMSVGTATSPLDGEDGETLIQAADRALYRAKAGGRNTWRTNSEMSSAEPREKAG